MPGPEKNEEITDPILQGFVMHELFKLRAGLKASYKAIRAALGKADVEWANELAATRSLSPKLRTKIWAEFERLKALESAPAKPMPAPKKAVCRWCEEIHQGGPENCKVST